MFKGSDITAIFQTAGTRTSPFWILLDGWRRWWWQLEV